jgi:hypothetical protein
MQWWVIAEASSTNMQGSCVVVQGNALQIKAKYNGAARGPYSSQAAAQQVANQPGCGAPGPNIPGNPGQAIGQAVSGFTGLNAIGDFANRLTQANTWVRVGEFIAGAILVIIAINAMTKGPVRSATTGTIKSGAKKAGALAAVV